MRFQRGPKTVAVGFPSRQHDPWQSFRRKIV